MNVSANKNKKSFTSWKHFFKNSDVKFLLKNLEIEEFSTYENAAYGYYPLTSALSECGAEQQTSIVNILELQSPYKSLGRNT